MEWKLTLKRTTYMQWLISYMPVFFISMASLILIFFMILFKVSENESLNANKLYARQVQQTIDTTFRLSEQLVVQEVISDDKLKQFLTSAEMPGTLEMFEMSEKIRQLIFTTPLVDSIYLYRENDRSVFGANGMFTLDSFGDRDFIQDALDGKVIGWSDARKFKEFQGNSSAEKDVVSLAREVPGFTGHHALIMINVQVSAIPTWLKSTIDSDISEFLLKDKLHNDLLASRKEPSLEKSPSVAIKSSYTGWVLLSQLRNKHLFQQLSLFTYLWFSLAVLAMMLGMFWMRHSIRRNYRPIQSILDQIHEGYGQRPGNELDFIQSALHTYAEESRHYQSQKSETLFQRRQAAVNDLLSGDRVLQGSLWQAEKQALECPIEEETLSVVVVEIDRYHEFKAEYNPKDQSLLKFVITNVAKECAEQNGFPTLSAWVGDHQLGILVFIESKHDAWEESIRGFCEQLRLWVESQLAFTISCAYGPEMAIEAVHLSYKSAQERLGYKMVLGNNRLLNMTEILAVSADTETLFYEDVRKVRKIVIDFRGGRGEWLPALTEVFSAIRARCPQREDIRSFMTYMQIQFTRDMMELPGDIQVYWKSHVLPRMMELIEQSELLGEFEGRWVQLLQAAETHIGQMKEHRHERELVSRIREYIAEHYMDYDLSLTTVSDHFHIPAKKLSRIFKEEYGEKFVDVVALTRMERAKELLEQSDEPVQEIANRVGYYHSISFIQAFKKLTGVTPGQFRLQIRQ
ncbi:helix-turn-helix transcriptional regulator [Paenibacillus aceris]|uniref:AraC-like DNA-binding protein n=1 Tax=Paenibacillus aceris TaxID=869555 RepID=A0ABS4I388_9BACL|nr:AraC family transcriptional regulator [Paenibacillus aceris]MBP1965369.1 AraC-like DNA-binding protein [Paenibacillus aceris]NHW36050.1 helix-turn-helix transcriptional regulator [Paenibacillus aceris]